MGVGRALGGMGLTRRRIAVAAGAVVLLVAGLGVILAAPAHPQAVQEGAVAALLVAAAGTAVVLVRQPGAGGRQAGRPGRGRAGTPERCWPGCCRKRRRT